ncbi:hypothetical protein CFC21_078093 [Triticum aestivum]|uniref:DUF1618 domain-containing protein n=3 Tax=Triticinae TaxID=1648030 RepID=A0A9R1HW29_WHEAT|nr:hypothetical protein CFC21_078093 [Triticum aestivum]
MSAAPEAPPSEGPPSFIAMSAAPEAPPSEGPSSSVAISTSPFPNWILLESFVFRRDDKKSFPDDTKAPIRASGITSWNAPFRIAFSLAKPPLASRLYAKLRRFPDPSQETPLAIVATHFNLLLLRVGTKIPARGLVQDFFICNAYEPSTLKALPPCREPYTDYSRSSGDNLPRGRPLQKEERRLLEVQSMGLLCGGGEKFAVAELCVFKTIHLKSYADICLLCSPTSAAPVLGGNWNSFRVPILGIDSNDPWHICCWDTDTVITFRHWLCWIDYHRGILFFDVFGEPVPTVTFLAFPLDEYPSPHSLKEVKPSSPLKSSRLYRGASVLFGGNMIKFVNVTRHDGIGYGELKPRSGFTITCHTLELGDTPVIGNARWKLDYKITSDELWSANPPEHLPHNILMFPQIDLDMPHLVHFIISEFEFVIKKMWLVSIDMKTKEVKSFAPYISGKEGLETDDADLIRERLSKDME